MGLSDLPDMRSMDNPVGTLTATGAGMSPPAAGTGIAAAPPFPVYLNFPKGIFHEREKMKKHNLYFGLVVIISVLVLSACGAAAATGTPTSTSTPVDIPALFTEAAQTVFAQLTQQAPTLTPTPRFTNTPTLPPATAVTPSATVQKCEDSAFVSDVTIPDGTQMAVNQHFTKTWRVQNTGTCTWITTFYLGFAYGELMGGQTKVQLVSAVAPGQTVDLSVSLVVPNKTGKLTGVWSLFDDKGNTVGRTLTVVVNVGVPSSTPTVGLTGTPGSTATSTLTPTVTPTP